MLRHGQAALRGSYANDADRPLTDEGRQIIRREAAVMAALLPRLDALLTSPYVRAAQTAEIVATALGMSARLTVDDRLAPGFSLSGLMTIAAEYDAGSAIMLVGHEPDISSTLAGASGGGRLVVKKGGLARLDLSEGPDPRGELVWLVPPAVLLGA